MNDVHHLAQAALAAVPMPPGRREIEADNLAAVMEAASIEARTYGVPEEEIEAQLRTTAEIHARGLALAYEPVGV